jgi:tight adherence protein C
MDPLLMQTILTWAAAALIGVAVIGGLATAVLEARGGSRVRARLAGPETSRAKAAAAGSNAPKALLQGLRRLGDRVAVSDPGQVSVLRSKLMQAGFMSREAVPLYLGGRIAALAAAAIVSALAAPWLLKQYGGFPTASVVGVLSILAMLGPERVLTARRAKLETEYRDGFPDLLDLLVASVEAGLSLDAAVSRVSEELDRRYPSLAEHLQILVREMRAGRSRKDSWQALAERLGIEEARSLATMLRQAEEMGTSLGETLAVFADDMRVKRMLKAEEKAAALPAKLTLPLILFIFPCLLGVLVLPAGIRLSRALGGG